MTGLTHPPRPQMAYRIGITGHRRNRIRADQIERIENELASVFSIIDEAVKSAHEAFSAYYEADPPVVRLITPLADGADSLAAKVALKHAFELHAPIPFHKAEYATDFEPDARRELEAFIANATSIYELDGGRTSDRDEATAYLAAGYMTLKQSDVLVAVWDGEGARGVGGTGMIVEAAVQQGIPVVWIHADEPMPACILSEELTCDKPLSELTNIVSHELQPPFVRDAAESDPELSEEQLALEVYLSETERRTNYGIFYRLMESLLTLSRPRGISIRKAPYLPRTEEMYHDLATKLPSAGTRAFTQMEEVLLSRFCWADNLALHYADIYRSSYAMNYFLSAFAVLLALMEILTGGWKFIWISVEVVTILAVLLITLRGKRNRWHEKWIDYRQLAEQLRHLRYLYLSGGLSRDSRAQQQSDTSLGSDSWVQWYYQATVRELGMAHIECTETFREELSRSYIDDELNPQISYHAAKSHTLEHMEHALHKTGEYLFAATLVICISFLGLLILSKINDHGIAYKLTKALKGFVTAATAFFPALGAATFGIRVQGEFASTASRSHAMSRRLAVTRDELALYAENAPPNLRDLRRNIETATETMMVEIVDWKFVFSSKPLSLPA